MRNFLFLFFIFSLVLNAQQPVSIHLTESDGLTDDEFYGITEDAKGFIWLAGNKGLLRYNGKDFQLFDHPEKRGLSVFELVVDQEDRVWCVNISGQLFRTTDTGLTLVADLKSQLKGNLPSLHVAGNSLYVSNRNNRIIVDVPSQSIIDEQRFGGSIRYTKPTVRDGKLIYLDDKYRYEKASGSSETKSYELETTVDSLYASFKGNRFLNLFTFNEHLFVFQYPELRTFDVSIHLIENGTLKSIKIPKILNRLRIDKFLEIEDFLWLATSDGVFKTSIEDNRLIIHEHLLPGIFTTGILKDIDGNFWISTLQDAVYVIPNLSIRSIDVEGRGDSKTLASHNNNLYIGTNRGDIDVYNTKTQNKSFFSLPVERPVSDLVFDRYRDELVIFQEGAMFTYKNNTLKKIQRSNLLNVKSANFISDKALLYADSFSGTILNYPEKVFKNDNTGLYSKSKRSYETAYDTVKQRSYIAFIDELISLDSDYNETVISDGEQSILSQSLAVTSSGILWVASFKKGLYKIIDNKVVSHFTIDNGLLSNQMSKLRADVENVWFGTEEGIQFYDAEANSFKNFTKRDGIPTYSINDIEIIDDQVYFSSSSGIFSIDKSSAFKMVNDAEIYITEVRINNQPQSLISEYTFDAESSDVSIQFNVNGFRNLNSGSYQYRLDDSDWIPLPSGTDRIQFSNLDAGKHSLHITSSTTEDSLVTPTLLTFYATTPFYKTAWFWFLVGALIIALLSGFYYIRLQLSKRKQQDQLKSLALDNELIALRLENLRSQMNPHFIFNALNSIQDYIVKNEKTLASSYLVKFSRLIRMYLDQSREHEITLSEELDAMRLYLELERVRFEDKLGISLYVDEELDTTKTKVPPLFIQPYVENALKHGLLHKKEDRKLEVSFKQYTDTNSLLVSIKDNGVGRARSEAIKEQQAKFHKSFATVANDSRVELLNSRRIQPITIKIIDLINTSNKPTGTQVNICIPQEKIVTRHFGR